ncbi:MAG: hypothetical protein ACTSRZ_08830 [Promethearchaeota archaeon]
MKHKSSHQFMAKMLSYQGLFVFLPYLMVHLLKLSVNPISEQDSNGFIIFMLIMFGVIFVFDMVGLKSIFLDRYSRIIIIIVSYFAASCIAILGYKTYFVWDNSDIFLLFIIGCISAAFLLLGWFYIRAEKTNRPSKEDKPLRSSSHCFAFVAISWGAGYVFGDIAILICIMIALIFYPIVVVIGDKKLVEDPKNVIRPERLAAKDEFLAFTDFITDITKVTFLFITCVIFSYNGEFILYPTEGLIDPTIYFRNLMWVSISASTTAFVFEQLEDVFFGKFIVILVFISAAGQSLFSFLNYNDQWLMFAILNGVCLAGVFTFVEQKIAKSGNVRVLPGSMFYVIFVMILSSLLLNNVEGIYYSIDIIRILISLGGIAYVYFRITIEKKNPDLRRQGVRYSPLGPKYYEIPNGENISS